MLAYNRNLKKINLSGKKILEQNEQIKFDIWKKNKTTGNHLNDDDIVQLVEAFDVSSIR